MLGQVHYLYMMLIICYTLCSCVSTWWEPLRTCGNLWEPLGTFGNLWEPPECSGNACNVTRHHAATAAQTDLPRPEKACDLPCHKRQDCSVTQASHQPNNNLQAGLVSVA